MDCSLIQSVKMFFNVIKDPYYRVLMSWFNVIADIIPHQGVDANLELVPSSYFPRCDDLSWFNIIAQSRKESLQQVSKISMGALINAVLSPKSLC